MRRPLAGPQPPQQYSFRVLRRC